MKQFFLSIALLLFCCIGLRAQDNPIPTKQNIQWSFSDLFTRFSLGFTYEQSIDAKHSFELGLRMPFARRTESTAALFSRLNPFLVVALIGDEVKLSRTEFSAGYKVYFPSSEEKGRVLHGFFIKPSILVGYEQKSLKKDGCFLLLCSGEPSVTEERNKIVGGFLFYAGKQWNYGDKFVMSVSAALGTGIGYSHRTRYDLESRSGIIRDFNFTFGFLL